MQTQSPQNTAASRIRKALRKRQVLDWTGLSSTHLYRLIQQGKFPKPHKLSERVSAWDSLAVEQWLAERFGLSVDRQRSSDATQDCQKGAVR